MDSQRADALYKLFMIKLRSKAPTADIILLGTAAIDADPIDPRAVDTLITMAQSLEKIGLLPLAQSQYNKIGLLNVTGIIGEKDNSMTKAIAQAMLGNARCLLQMGERIKADHLLRELCNNFGVEPVRSEAAYWWATLALEAGQTAEARRRLGLADTAQATPEIAAKIQFERNLLDISSGKSVEQTMDIILERIADLPQREFNEFILRAFNTYFEELLATKNYDALQTLMTFVAFGPHANQLPLKKIFLELASEILVEKGPNALAEFIRSNQDVITVCGESFKEQTDYLLGSVTNVEDLKRIMDNYMSSDMNGTDGG